MSRPGLHAFDDIEKEEAAEMAGFCRGRVPLLGDCVEAGRQWALSGRQAAWIYLRQVAEDHAAKLEKAEEEA